MRCRKVFLAAAIGLGLLTGCAGHQVADHSYQFNEATGSLHLRLLLLNAVRASKDYPLQFSKIQSYQGSGTTTASISASLPLKFPGSGTASPKVDLKDGISEFNLVDLNTEESQQALKKTFRSKCITITPCTEAAEALLHRIFSWLSMSLWPTNSIADHRLRSGKPAGKARDYRKANSLCMQIDGSAKVECPGY